MSINALYPTAADDIPAVAMTNHCIVLDLDLTLLSTQESTESLATMKILSDPQLMELRKRIYYITIEDLEKPGIGTRYDFWGVTRPHLNKFLMFCFSYFKIVAVWSAGKRPYVEAIVDHLFKDLPKPHVVFSYDDVIMTPQGHVEKPLLKMINYDLVLKRNMSLENTFALDDNSMTFYHNIDNGILIPAYEPALNITAFMRDDPTLLQLQSWLLLPEVATAKDIRKLDKSRIFSTSLSAYKEKLAGVPGYNFI